MITNEICCKIREIIDYIDEAPCGGEILVSNEDPIEVANLLIRLADDIVFEGDESEDCQKYYEWVDKTKEQRCYEINGGHEWAIDQCGFWGHQYCTSCGQSKYPELPGSCNEALREIKKMVVETEAQYLQSKIKQQGER